MSNYNEYEGIPQDLIPTLADASPLFDIVSDVKEAIKIRHDFQTAVALADQARGVRRLPGQVPFSIPVYGTNTILSTATWESDFAQSYRADGKTMAGLAAEHKRLTVEALSYIPRVRSNAKLARLMQENLRSLFPDIGYRESTGEPLHRLRKDHRSVLQLFKPLGVEDTATLIRLLLKPLWNGGFYW